MAGNDSRRSDSEERVKELERLISGQREELAALSESNRALSDERSELESLRIVFDTVADGIFVTDAMGGIREVNRAASRMLGVAERGEVIGCNALDFVSRGTRKKAVEDFERVLRDGSVFRAEHVCKPISGAVFPVEISGSVMTDGEGRPTGVIGVMKDITDRKKLEEERQKAAKLESVGILAGGIAHDFNNLLTVVLSNISVAVRNLDDPEAVETRLVGAHEALLRARQLTTQLLTFARGGAPVKKPTAVRRMVVEALELVQRDSRISTRLLLPDGLWTAECDPGQVGQVLRNLLINAYQAMPAGGEIVVEARNEKIGPDQARRTKPGRFVAVTVGDGGPGIPEDILARVFDPYFTTKPSGSGLGLATSYSIMEKHGGAVWLESPSGGGARAHILLPADPDIILSSPTTNELPVVTGSGRILVMDDDPAVAEAICSMLADLDYDSEVASHGEEAVSSFRREMERGDPFDAVLMDLTVATGMGGAEAMARLQEIDPEVCAIVASGYSSDPVMAAPDAYGFKAVLAKPFSVAELGAALAEVLGRSEEEEGVRGR